MTLRELCPLLPDVAGHYIGGRFLPPTQRLFPNTAPASDALLAEVPCGDAATVEAAVDAAQTALAGDWGRSTPGQRAQLLRRIGDLILREQEALARLEALDTGKPLAETLGGDVPRAAANFHFFADLAAHQAQPCFTSDDGAQHTTVREPIGIVGLITPWNLPLYLATWKLAPALAQGNAVILKPAELTPLSAMALASLLQAAGVPPGVVNIVQGFGPEAAGEAIVRHPQIKAISFTGETTTGEAIMRTAASALKKLSFELGGKGATVVFADADLDLAAQTIARAAFRNQGQICLAGSRLIVAQSVADALLEKVLAAVRTIKIGDPLATGTTMGSLIAKSHRDKVAGYVDRARRDRGVEVLCGGRIPPDFAARGAFYEPTIVTGLAADAALVREDVFGPVLSVQTFSDFATATAMLNSTDYGLSCSIFTRDLALAQRAARAAKTGLVWINSWFIRDLHTAFGGMKRSGIGREGGQLSLDFFSEMKTITMPGGC